MEVKVEGTPVDKAKLNDKPAERGDTPEAKNDNVLNTRVGSEASVASGLAPVPGTIGGIADATKVHNKDLAKRDEEENKRRGRHGPLPENVSANWTGLMMVEVDGEKAEPKSGSFSGHFVKTLTIRKPTEAEIEELTPGSGVEPRAGDKTLVKGSGTGGGGNPMHSGSAAGVSSKTADRQDNPAGGVRTSRN